MIYDIHEPDGGRFLSYYICPTCLGIVFQTGPL